MRAHCAALLEAAGVRVLAMSTGMVQALSCMCMLQAEGSSLRIAARWFDVQLDPAHYAVAVELLALSLQRGHWKPRLQLPAAVNRKPAAGGGLLSMRSECRCSVRRVLRTFYDRGAP